MKVYAILLIILLIGCSDTEENASTNLRKGDEFFKKGEYEVAEYYYDKIPEESVLYKTVIRRKEEIQKINEDPTLDKRSMEKTKGVFITKHTFQVNNLGVLPIHRITLLNNTDDNLQFVELEFVYYDAKGSEVQRLSTVVNTYVAKHTQKDFDKISPGIVNTKFTRANAILVKPVFY